MKASVVALYLGRLVSSGSTVLLLAVVGRLAGGDGLGIVGVGMAMGSLLAAITEQGASMLVVRAIAQRPGRAPQTVAALAAIRLVMLPLGLAVAYGVLALVFPDHLTAIWLAAAWLAVQQATELTRATLVAANHVVSSAVHTSVENLAWVAAIAVPLLAHAPLEVAFTAGLGVLLASNVAGFLIVRLQVGWFPRRPDRSDFSAIARETPAFSAFAILGQLYSRVDTLLIGALLPGGLAAAGAYFASMRLIAGLEYLPEAISRALYPRLARAFVADPSSIRGLLTRPTDLLLRVSVPVPFAAFIAAAWGLPLLFGPDAAGYGWILMIVSLFVPMRFLGYMFGLALTTGGAQAKRALAVALAAVIVIGLDAALLPRIGLVAAVIAIASAWVSTFGIYVYQVHRAFGLPPMLGPLLRSAALAAVAFVPAGAIRLGVPDPIGSPAALAVFCLIYVGLAFLSLQRLARPATERA